jgi:hypothetical protein
MFTDAAIIFEFGNSAAFGTPVVPEVIYKMLYLLQ